MKIIVLGASGMLGHVIALYFKKKYPSKIILCSRSKINIKSLDKILLKIPEYSKEKLSLLIEKHRPCKIINCVGVNKLQFKEEKLYLINSNLPKLLFDLLKIKNDGSQLIQISTNGVFSGKRGDYIETDRPDTEDAYGKSKIKGEIIKSPHLTIRTSIIGPEINSSNGLLEWFLKQKKEVKGYTEVNWNGVTTLECAKFIDWALNNKITGLVHLFSETISKYNLLNLVNVIYKKKIKIYPDNDVRLNRTLKTKRSDLNYSVPDHSKMLKDLKNLDLL